MTPALNETAILPQVPPLTLEQLSALLLPEPKPTGALTLRTPDGPVHLTSYAGALRIVMILSLECSLCATYAPVLETLCAEHGLENFQPLGVLMNWQSDDAVRAYQKAHAITFPIGHVPVYEIYGGLKLPGATFLYYPSYAFVDRLGNMRAFVHGEHAFFQNMEENTRALLEVLL